MSAEVRPFPGGGGIVTLNAADVRPRRVEFLWEGRVPLAKVTLIEGDPGQGKSLLLLDLAARVTTGEPMPGETKRREPKDVVVMSAEDDEADTLVPRLMAAGAVLSRVHFVTMTRGEDGELLPFDLARDGERLATKVREVKAILVIVDPVVAYMPAKADTKSDHNVRQALMPLKTIADSSKCAVIAVRHLNKSSEGRAMYRGGGSIGFIASVRSGLLVAVDADGRHVVAVVKSNIAIKPRSLTFSIKAVTVGTLDGPAPVPLIEWGEECDTTADELVRPAEDNSQVNRAVAFLARALANGQQQAKTLYAEAEANGIGERALKDAKARLKVKADKGGFGAGWFWSLPGGDE